MTVICRWLVAAIDAASLPRGGTGPGRLRVVAGHATGAPLTMTALRRLAVAPTVAALDLDPASPHRRAMIDRLEILIALARERHFGRAADALGVSQPSLSAGLRTLEDQLGVQLVRRGSRFQGLTPEGERALDWARRIVGEARAFRADMRALREGITGELRLGVIPTAAARVAALTGPFLSANPQARLAVVTLSSDAIIAGIDALELDAAITYQITIPARLLRLPLYAEHYCLVAQGGGDGPASWAEAAGQPLALLSRDMRNRRVVEQMLAASGAPPVVPRIESNSTLAILGCVAAGPWAAILPQALVAELPLPQGVTARPLPADAAGGGRGAGRGSAEGGEAVALVTRDLSPQPPLVGALLATLR